MRFLRKFKVLIASMMLLWNLVVPSTSNAFIPVAIAAYVVGEELAPWALASLAIHATALVGLIVANMTSKSPSSHAVEKQTGNISRDVKVDWVDLTGSQPMIKETNASVSPPLSGVQNDLANNPSTRSAYPELNKKLMQPDIANLSVKSSAGQKYLTPDGSQLITKVTIIGCSGPPSAAPEGYSTSNNGTSTTMIGPADEAYCGYKTLGKLIVFNYDAPQETFNFTKKTPAQVYQQLTGNDPAAGPPAAPLTSDLDTFKDDVDKYIHSNPNIVHFDDGPATNVGSNDPFGIPPHALSDSDVNNWWSSHGGSATGTGTGTGTGSTGGSGSGSGSGGGSGSGSGSGYGNYSSVSSSTDKYTDSSGWSGPAPRNAYGDGSKFDFGERFNQFISDLKGSALFALPNSLAANIPSGGDAVIAFDGGRYGRQSFSFATMFAGVFGTIKAILLVVFSWVGIRIITLKK